MFTKAHRDQMLEVVDENDNIVGLENRVKVHTEGLLHREIHIWFLTPTCKVIFQHRAKDKDTYPDLLDATVGGHVEPNDSYEETAVHECMEETGININLEKLVFLRKAISKSVDEVRGLINNSIRSQYAYLYEGDINDLRVEKNKALGFEAWKLYDLMNLSEKDRKRFIPIVLTEENLLLFQDAKLKLGIR